MKFGWKVFLSTIMVIAVVFAMGGYVLITSSFQASLTRATERALEENQFIKIAYESAAENYDAQASKLTDEAIANIAQQLNKGGKRGIVMFNEDYEPISSHDDARAHKALMEQTGEGRTYVITQQNGEYMISVSCISTAGERLVYIETSRNITNLFKERESQFQDYIRISIFLLLASAAIMWIVSMFLTRPLRRLSAATRKIAQGDYGVRMPVLSHDEIGDFTNDFNAMTNAL